MNKLPTLHSVANSLSVIKLFIAAAKQSCINILELLHLGDDCGQTMLHNAVIHRQLHVVTYLKELIGVERFRELVHVVDKQGNSALHYCKDQDIAAMFIKAVAGEKKGKGKKGNDARKEKLKGLIDLKNKYGQTASHLASEAGATEVLKILLRENMSEEQQKDHKGNTALHYAKNGTIAAQLTKRPKRRMDFMLTTNCDGNTALHTARTVGCVTAITDKFKLKSALEEFILMKNNAGLTAGEALRLQGLDKVADRVAIELRLTQDCSESDNINRNHPLERVYADYIR